MGPDFVGRVKRLLTTPQTEWDAIDLEAVDSQSIALNYVAPLAAIPAVASFIGNWLFAGGGFFGSFFSGLISFVLSVSMVFVFAFIINALAPNFGAQRNFAQALKLSAYAPTAGWIAGVFNLIPALKVLTLLGGLYSLYLLFIGLPKLMKPGPEKGTPYAVVSILAAIAAGWFVAILVGAPGGGDSPSPSESSRRALDERMAEYQRSRGGQAAVIAGPIVKVDALKKLAPEKIAGVRRDEVNVDSIARPFPARVLTATYREEGRSVTFKIISSPMATSLADVAGFAGAEYDRTSDDGYERLRREKGGYVLEQWSQSARSGKYARTVGPNFMVEAEGIGVDRNVLKRTVEQYSEGRLKRLPVDR